MLSPIPVFRELLILYTCMMHICMAKLWCIWCEMYTLLVQFKEYSKSSNIFCHWKRIELEKCSICILPELHLFSCAGWVQRIWYAELQAISCDMGLTLVNVGIYKKSSMFILCVTIKFAASPWNCLVTI